MTDQDDDDTSAGAGYLLGSVAPFILGGLLLANTNEDPTVFSAYGYTIIDSFIKAAQKAGPNLTTDSFVKAMDSMSFEPDMFGSAKATYTATKRLGNDQSRLSQIQNGKWVGGADYLK